MEKKPSRVQWELLEHMAFINEFVESKLQIFILCSNYFIFFIRSEGNIKSVDEIEELESGQQQESTEEIQQDSCTDQRSSSTPGTSRDSATPVYVLNN